MPRIFIISVITVAWLVGGCMSVYSVESNWTITSGGPASAALQALGRAAAATGGKPLADPGPVSLLYRFGSSTVSFQISGSDIAVLATTATPPLASDPTIRAGTLLNRIISRAAQESGLSLRLKPEMPSAMPARVTGVAKGNIGTTPQNMRFAAYAAYLRRMSNMVDHAWDEVIGNGSVFPPPNTSVVVTFLLDPHGRIARIVNVDNHSSQLGANLVMAALTRSSYGEWTPEMKAALNSEGEELTFTFYYQ